MHWDGVRALPRSAQPGGVFGITDTAITVTFFALLGPDSTTYLNVTYCTSETCLEKRKTLCFNECMVTT